jgi:hypothetical protein
MRGLALGPRTRLVLSQARQGESGFPYSGIDTRSRWEIQLICALPRGHLLCSVFASYFVVRGVEDSPHSSIQRS